MTCPGSNTVQALLDGALAGREREAFLTHAADCPQCRALVGTLVASEAGPARRAPDLDAGTRVGRFVVEARLGGGAGGVVYAARDPELDRRVAIKLLRADPLDEDDTLERRARMQREAQALARVSHANVMTVFDVGAHGGQVFIAMELIDGWTVRGWLAAAPRGWRAVLDTYLAAARGLAAAHAVGVVHRDFKPDNVLVGRDGRVLVTDFGLARRVGAPAEAAVEDGSEVTLTRTGTLMGTPAYMSPEQHAGAAAGEASDQFSFCVALHEGLYGERPFPGRTVGELGEAVRRGRPRLPRNLGGVPRALRRAILRGLAREPERRHPSLRALIAELEALRRPRGRRWLIAAAAALALAGAAAVVVAARGGATGVTPAAGPRPGIAVLPLRNGAGRPQLDWLASALPEMLATELAAGEQLRTVPLDTIRGARLAPDAAAAAEQLGARYLVTGSFAPAGERVRVDLRLEEPGGAGVLASYGETVPEAELVELATRAGARFRARLGVPGLSDEEAGRVRATQPANPEAARLHTQALERQRAGDLPGALPLLEQAVARDPRFARGQADLATVLHDLGYGDRARAAAQAARALARSLPREEQLVIEASAAWASGDAGEAIRGLEILYGFFPDRHDYGIELMATLANVNRNAEAAALLRQLRAVGPPTSSALELDRVELYLAVDEADLDRAATLARRMAERGRADGQPYLVADALFNLGSSLWFRGDLEGAARTFVQLIAAQRKLDDPGGLATAQRMLGSVRQEQGRLREARAGFEEALALDRRVGNAFVAKAPVVLAEVLAAQGEVAAAEELRASAPLEETLVSSSHASIALLSGRLADARAWIEASVERQRERPYFLGLALLLRARIRQAQGDFEAARQGYEEAAAAARRRGHELTRARVELGLAGLDVDEGRAPAEHLRAALPLLAREGLLAELAWAAALAGDAEGARRLAASVEDVGARDLVALRAGADPDPIRERAARSGAVLVEMEARLCRARLGREPRSVLERDARARGLGRIARLAAGR